MIQETVLTCGTVCRGGVLGGGGSCVWDGDPGAALFLCAFNTVNKCDTCM